MNTETMDWNKIWETPDEILRILAENQKCRAKLRLVKERIKREKREENKVQKRGYIIEKERKTGMISEVMQIDRILAEKLRAVSNSEEAAKIFDERIAELEKISKDAEHLFRKILSEERKTVESGAKLVDRFLFILKQTEEIYRKQVTNTELNDKYEQELLLSAQNNTMAGNLKYFEKEAHKAAERAKENKMLDEQAIVMIDSTAKMQDEARQIQQKFKTETDEINKILELLAPLLTEKEEKKEEAQLRKLQPAWGRT